MSLDFSLYEVKEVEIGWFNITYNLNIMADKAGIYYALWRPEEVGCKYAKDIIRTLENGLKSLKDHPDYYKKFNAKNGWGLYEDFVPWVEKVLQACKKHPNSIIKISR